jgi:hypothetical protein
MVQRLPVHRLVGSANDKHAEATERRVLDSITQRTHIQLNMSSEVRVYETSAIHPVLVANSPFEKKFSTEINLLTEDGQEEQGREGVGATQGPDTLVAFVRISKGCEDTHQPVRGSWHY